MILNMLTLNLEPVSTGGATEPELRRFFAARFLEYTKTNPENAGTFIHRYPVVQVRVIKNVLHVTGINEGAAFLAAETAGTGEITVGTAAYRIFGQKSGPTDEEFGPADTMQSYEFVTPWSGLNQENYRKFYDLKGKIERDNFVTKNLAGSILTLAKALGLDIQVPVKCTTNLHFQKARIDGKSVMTFTGKFQANFYIPDYLALGKSVSHGYGAIRKTFLFVPENPGKGES